MGGSALIREGTMLKAFRYVALLIAVEVMVQEGMIAFAMFGLGKWVDDGKGTLTKANEEHLHFTGAAGFTVHGINGTMVIPLLALIALILAFFTQTAGTRQAGGILFGLVVVQVLLGVFAHAVVVVGILHGMFALALFGFATMTFVRFGRLTPATA